MAGVPTPPAMNPKLEAVLHLQMLYRADPTLATITDDSNPANFLFTFSEKNKKFKYLKKMKTPFRVAISKDSHKDNELFTLDSLIFFLQNVSKSQAEYITAASSHPGKIQAVKHAVRKGLIDFFSGKVKIEKVKNYDASALESSASGSKKRKHDSENIGEKPKKADKKKEERPTINKSDERMLKFWQSHEQPLSTLTSILRCRVELGSILQPILKLYKDKKNRKKEEANKKKVGFQEADDGANNEEDKNRSNKIQRRAQPIIIVPGSSSSAITISNIKPFMESGRYIDPTFPEANVVDLDNHSKPSSNVLTQLKAGEVIIHRPASQISGSGVNTPVHYALKSFRVTNNPNRLSEADWKNVVCVFVQGQAWQFKNWEMFKTPAEVFDNMCGVYLYFENDKVPIQVKQWNAREFKLKRQQRSMDQITSHRVWEEIDNFIANKKKFLIE